MRIKGARAAAKESEGRIEPGTEYSRPLQTGTAFPIAGCCLLLKRPGPWWYRPPPGLFFFASICLYLVSVSVIMKTLLLLRHAKAENAAAGSSDINRALNERGKKEAQAIAEYILKTF